jgi:hypothetical protein
VIVDGGERLTEADRRSVVEEIRSRYAAAGVPWPDRVVWMPSPITGWRAAVVLARRFAEPADRRRAVGEWWRRDMREPAVRVLVHALIVAGALA